MLELENVSCIVSWLVLHKTATINAKRLNISPLTKSYLDIPLTSALKLGIARMLRTLYEDVMPFLLCNVEFLMKECKRE